MVSDRRLEIFGILTIAVSVFLLFSLFTVACAFMPTRRLSTKSSRDLSRDARLVIAGAGQNPTKPQPAPTHELGWRDQDEFMERNLATLLRLAFVMS